MEPTVVGGITSPPKTTPHGTSGGISHLKGHRRLSTSARRLSDNVQMVRLEEKMLQNDRQDVLRIPSEGERLPQLNHWRQCVELTVGWSQVTGA